MPDRAASTMRGFLQFCRAQSARMRAQVIWDTRQNRFPRAPLRGACSVVDPARSGMTPAFRLSTRKETTMIDLYDHIQNAASSGAAASPAANAPPSRPSSRKPSGNRPNATALWMTLSQLSTGQRRR